MRQAYVPFKNLPQKLKAAIALFGIHILFYSITIGMIFVAGDDLQPMWVIHIFIAGFLANEMRRSQASLYYVILTYCIFISFRALLETTSVLALLTYIPLLLVVACILKEKKFYLPERKTQD